MMSCGSTSARLNPPRPPQPKADAVHASTIEPKHKNEALGWIKKKELETRLQNVGVSAPLGKGCQWKLLTDE